MKNTYSNLFRFIAYVLEGLSRNSGLPWDRTPINGKTTNSFCY